MSLRNYAIYIFDVFILLFVYFALIATSHLVAHGQIPNANEALAGVEVGQPGPGYLYQGQAEAAELTFWNTRQGIADPTSVFRAANIPEAVKASYLSVVRITASAGNSASMGSGTYLGDGLVITNRHVVDGGYKFNITLKDGTNYPAQLLRTSGGEADLALLAVPNLDNRLKAVPLAVEEIRQGQVIYPSGFDQGNLRWHTIWPARVFRYSPWSSYEAAGIGSRRGSISGNSGGPCFNSRGELISPLWGTRGDTQGGTGSTYAVCFRSTRSFLLPWRRRIMAALENQYRGYGRTGPIIIQIGAGEQFRQAPQPAQPKAAPQGYLIEGKMIPIVELNKSNATQYGYCEPSYGGGNGQCPPSAGSPYSSPYGSPYGGSDPSRPVLPDVPSYQPPSGEPQKIELDYDKLADALLPKMAGDDRFKGKQGEAGKDGQRGPVGPQGPQGQVTQTQIAAMSAAILSQMATDDRFRGKQGRPGEITPEQISELTEQIKRGLSRRVLVIDDSQEKVLSDETYAHDKPIILDLTKLVRQASINGGSR